MYALLHMVESGFPEADRVFPHAAPYWQFWHALYISDGVLMFEDCVIIPPSLRHMVLDTLPTRERPPWSFGHVPSFSGQASLRTSMLSGQGVQNVTGTPHPSPRYQLLKPHHHQPCLNQSTQISLTLQVCTSLQLVTGCLAGQRSFPAPLAPPTPGLRASLDASVDSLRPLEFLKCCPMMVAQNSPQV